MCFSWPYVFLLGEMSAEVFTVFLLGYFPFPIYRSSLYILTHSLLMCYKCVFQIFGII